MELSQEQTERIKQNRERALEIQRQSQSLQCTIAAEGNNKNDKTDAIVTTKRSVETNYDINETNMKRRKDDQSIERTRKGLETDDSTANAGTNQVVVDSEDKFHTDEIEAFEENASEHITKQEAMKVYCLPMGTLDVCLNCITKPNPIHPTWSDMKLYLRKEIRYRAHQRYGGMLGLTQERNKRNQLRLQKDMEQSRDIFK